MNENETTAPVRAFDRAYINGKFVTPDGTQAVDLVNPTDNTVIGKVTMSDEIDTRQAIAAAKQAFNTFSQSSKEYRMDYLQRRPAALGQRRQQPPLPRRMAHPQVLPAPVELVKLQLHGGCSVASRFSMGQAGTGLFRQEGKLAWNSRGINYIRAQLVFR
jgi:hypothetical protein